MPISLLLDKTNAPLHRLSLHRVQLDRHRPTATLHATDEELVIYPLVGAVAVEVLGDPGPVHAAWNVPGRRSVFHRGLTVIRLAARPAWTVEFHLPAGGWAADLLVAGAMSTDRPAAETWRHGRNEIAYHDVGEGAFTREVRVVQTPPFGVIHAGETVNTPGGWSSWPAHCTVDERQRFAAHEEIFFVLCDHESLIRLDGVYQDGRLVNESRILTNGESLVVPLGHHPIVALPNSRLWYAWFYLSFLEKTYNQWAHDLGVYVR